MAGRLEIALKHVIRPIYTDRDRERDLTAFAKEWSK